MISPLVDQPTRRIALPALAAPALAAPALAALALAGCGPKAESPAPVVEVAATATPAPTSAATWPASLPVFGDGFPKPGDPCRRVGENAATVDFLDDSASLVGCLTSEQAKALGGKVVATVDGVTLVSVPAQGTASH